MAVLLLMTAAGFASVPLYRLFCQSTGFNGYVSRAKTAPTAAPLAQTLRVSFDTNIRDLPWTFRAEAGGQTIHIGKASLAFFDVTNNGDTPLTGHAVYNVVPEQAGAYFHKLQCFCFTDQTIAAHATMRFPVIYFVDPAFVTDPDTKDFTDVTLAYTFYPAPQKPGSNPGKISLGQSGSWRGRQTGDIG